MPPEEVVWFVDWLERRSVVYQCNGGWAVDALVGRETRPHRDLDVFLDEVALDDALAVLRERGYAVVDDWLPVRIELAAGDRRIDLHPMQILPGGDGVQALLDGGELVHRAADRTTGSIGGRAVVVASAARLLQLREGYEPREVDVHDVALLRRLEG